MCLKADWKCGMMFAMLTIFYFATVFFHKQNAQNNLKQFYLVLLLFA